MGTAKSGIAGMKIPYVFIVSYLLGMKIQGEQREGRRPPRQSGSQEASQVARKPARQIRSQPQSLCCFSLVDYSFICLCFLVSHSPYAAKAVRHQAGQPARLPRHLLQLRADLLVGALHHLALIRDYKARPLGSWTTC